MLAESHFWIVIFVHPARDALASVVSALMAVPRSVMDQPTPNVAATAAIMMLQSLILAMIEKGLLSGEDVLSSLEDVIDARRAGGVADGDRQFYEAVVRVVTCTAEEVATIAG